MILLVGQVAREQRGREAFQEVDLRAMFEPLAKWVFEIDDAERIPELIAARSTSPPRAGPGPVVIGLPEDMQRDETDAPDAVPFTPATPRADAADARASCGRCSRRRSGHWSWPAARSGARTRPTRCATTPRPRTLPVVCSFRRQDHLDNDSSAYVGDLGLGVGPHLTERAAGERPASSCWAAASARCRRGAYRHLTRAAARPAAASCTCTRARTS